MIFFKFVNINVNLSLNILGDITVGREKTRTALQLSWQSKCINNIWNVQMFTFNPRIELAV